MPYSKYLFFLLISLSFIVGQIPNKPNETKETTTKEPPLRKVTSNLNATNHSRFNMMMPPKPDSSFSISVDEMDKLMICSLIVQESIKNQHKEIEEVAKRLNLTDVKKINKVFDKVGTDIFEKCTDSIDMNLVNKYMKNFTFVNDFKWEKCYDDYSRIDYDKYMGEDDLVYTVKQSLLMNKYGKVKEKYKQKLYQERRNMYNEKKKIKIGKYEINKLPSSIKIGFFLVILLIFFGTVFYCLRTLENKPLEKKKKEKKKKAQ